MIGDCLLNTLNIFEELTREFMRRVRQRNPLATLMALIPFRKNILNLDMTGCTPYNSIDGHMTFFQKLFSFLFWHIRKLNLHSVNEYIRNRHELVEFLVVITSWKRAYDIRMEVWDLFSIFTSYLTNWKLFLIVTVRIELVGYILKRFAYSLLLWSLLYLLLLSLLQASITDFWACIKCS